MNSPIDTSAGYKESPSASSRNLSGGTTQKVALAKWLAIQPDVLILDEPTRGIGCWRKAEVHQIIARLADQGVAILLISSATA